MDKAKRKAIIAGNWKMNKTASEAAVLVDELVPAVQDAGCEVVICTPFKNCVVEPAEVKANGMEYFDDNEDLKTAEKLISAIEQFLRS